MKSNKQDLLNTFLSDSLTYQQKLFASANCAERYFDPKEVLGYSQLESQYLSDNILCDLNEGNVPYRPRYIVVDFNVLLENGCQFLELEKPTNLDELLDSLLILYKHIPSVTSFPVYIGDLDALINPFLSCDDQSDHIKIKRFLNHIDKTIPDSFCHANLGPKTNQATKLILEAVLELNNPTPNLTFIYQKGVSDEDIYTLAIKAGLLKAKPSFANIEYCRDVLDKYAFVSCYNHLPKQGGAYSLTRIRLGTLARKFDNQADFFKELNRVIQANLSLMDKRVDFIVNKSNFFKTSFLLDESFIKKENFTSMIAIVGLFECVNHLLSANVKAKQFGFNANADDLAHQILQFIDKLVSQHYAPLVIDNKYVLHAQVGASLSDEDYFNTPAHRLKVGEEPMLYDHIKQIAPFHQYFSSGVGDLFAFDQTYSTKPEALKPIIAAAFKYGMRYISLYQKDSDLIRVTGYLVKKSEVAKFESGQVVLRDTEIFGSGTNKCANVFKREVKTSDHQ